MGGFLAGAAILYVTLQGFAVITNAAPSFATPRRTVPRAVAISLAVVAIVYVIVGLMVVSALPPLKSLVPAGNYWPMQRLLSPAPSVSSRCAWRLCSLPRPP